MHVCVCLCWFSSTLSMIVREALAGESMILCCWDSREAIFSMQTMLSEGSRLANSYWYPFKLFLSSRHSPHSPHQQFLLYNEVHLHSSRLLSSHLPGVKIISVSEEMSFQQVVRKRKGGRTGERQREVYTSVKSSKRTVCQSQSLCLCKCERDYSLALQ